MFGKRKLKDEIVRLKYRVEELEERLCPCEQHKWVQTSIKTIYDRYGSYDNEYLYKCAVCGKKTRSYTQLKGE